MATSAAVMVIGSTMIDMTTYSRKIPHAGETVIGDTFRLGHGGKRAGAEVAQVSTAALAWLSAMSMVQQGRPLTQLLATDELAVRASAWIDQHLNERIDLRRLTDALGSHPRRLRERHESRAMSGGRRGRRLNQG